MKSPFLTGKPARPILAAACIFATLVLISRAQTAGTFAPPTTPATAGSAPASANAIANMSDDIESLRHLVGQLQLDVKNLQQENQDLRAKIISQTDLNAAVQNAVAKNRDETNKAIAAAVKQGNDDLRKDIVTTVTKQIEALARDTNTQLQTLAKAIGKPPPVSSHVTTADPNQTPPPPSDEKVETYVVKAGESVSKIAARFHVSVAEIAKLNPTIDVNKVREGQMIGIPLKNGASALPAATN